MRLWQALENIYGGCGVRRYWEHYLGGPLEHVQPYLRPTQGVVEYFPRWVEGQEVDSYEVVEHGPDDIVIVEPCSREAIPIAREELVAYELNRERLLHDLAIAFGFRTLAMPVGSVPFAWPVGVYEPLSGYEFAAYFTFSFDRARQTKIITALAATQNKPFLILAPTSVRLEASAQQVIEQKKISFIPLCDTVALAETGLQLTGGADILLDRFRDVHVPTMVATRGDAFFPTPAGATWDQVQIRFLDGHSVSIRVGAVSAVYEYGQLGMADKRNARPTKQWELLRAFARNGGSLRWGDRDADRRNIKRRERLASDLRAFFRIDGEPIVATDDGKGWRAVFAVQDDT